MAATGLHISISAEEVFRIGGLPITNSVLTSLIASTILISFALLVRLQLSSTGKPSGIQNVAEWIIESMHNLVFNVTGNLKKTRHFFPVVTTFFLFILVNNWLGLLPGVGTIMVKALHEGETVPLFRAGTADLNTTFALAIFSVLLTQLIGYHYLKFSYFKKFINFSSPIMFFVGFLEIISEFAKVISFAFRLFGNIFAGEVLLTVIAFLVAPLLPIPFYGLELFVGMIQALVFAMLSLVFYNMATLGHDEH